MAELRVCLTFDHDNASSFISRGWTSPTLISAAIFGIVAVPRITRSPVSIVSWGCANSAP